MVGIQRQLHTARSAQYVHLPRGGLLAGVDAGIVEEVEPRGHRQAERLTAISLRCTVNIHLENLGVTTAAAVGAAAGLPAAEAVGLLARRQWRAGNVDALQTMAERLKLDVMPPDTNLL